MRLLLTIGRMTIVDVSLFRIDEPVEEPDVIVVHHHTDDDDDESDGPDLFGGKGN